MSWAGGTYEFDEKTNINKMRLYIEEDLNMERGHMEPCHLPLKLLNDDIYDDREAAEERLSDLYGKYGRHYNYGVRFYDYSGLSGSKKVNEIFRKIHDTREKMIEYNKSHTVRDFKAEYIGCPSCGSKLKRELLRSDLCPLCHTDMRSKTVLDNIARYNSKIKDLERQSRVLQKAEEKKNASKRKVKWLIHAEAYLG